MAKLHARLKEWQAKKAHRKAMWNYWIRRERRAKTNQARERAHKKRAKWSALYERAAERVQHLKHKIKEKGNARWAHCRGVTNEVIGIVGGRARVTSRKRWEIFGNPGSDHYRGNKTADAVDFGIAEAHSLKNEISRKLGGPAILPDYGSFITTRDGRQFRVQIIAGKHGTGPHLHVGVKRV